MNTFTLTQRRFSARLFAVLTIFSLLLSAFPAAFFVAEAQIQIPEYFCKAVGNGFHKQLLQPVEVQQLNDGKDTGLMGSGINSKNIIPPFGDFPGFNWQLGAPWWNNHCVPPPTTGSITIEKVAGDDVTTEFDFTGTLGSFMLIGGSDTGSDYTDIDPGLYTITESDEAGWDLLDVTCTSGDWEETLPSVIIDLAAGDDVTCTFTNRPDQQNPEVATFVAHKIVCTDEAELPNWGAGGPNITASTAADWVAAHDSCELVSGWDFQWALDSNDTDPGDTLVGPAGAPWTTFGSTGVNGATTLTLSAAQLAQNTKVWFREVLKPDYLAFSHQANTDNSNNVTAELYCHNDALNYDNYDYVNGIELDKTYHCVAWNVPVDDSEPNLCTVTIKSDATNTVDEKGGAFAKVLSFVHDGWTESLLNADWIWGDDGVVDSTVDETQTFVNQFGWGGDTILDATLTIAADNSFSADLNGSSAGQDLGEFNYAATKDYDVMSLIQSGNNELEVMVENFGLTDSTPTSNPAGLYYELVINGEGDNCDIPYDPDPVLEFSDVTMCKYDQGQNPLSGWTLMLLGDEVDDVNVPASASTGVDTVALTGGMPYVALASGTWENNRSPLNLVDAEYSTEDNWLTHMDGFTGYGVSILELAIEGVDGNWGTYNSAHNYAQSFVPTTTGPVNFSVLDSNYGDNTGSLDVTVYEGYSGITGSDGCVTFEDVPVGTYTSDEIQQDNWSNLSGLGTVAVDSETELINVVNSDSTVIPVCDPRVNLIENGGFEAPVVAASTYEIFYTGEPLLEWITGDYGIEIQNNIAGTPYAGSQLAELDPNHPTMIWQEVPTIPGETYRFSTQYSPRPQRDLEDNRFEFLLNGSTLGASIARDGSANLDTVWTYEERMFVATGSTTTVGFVETGTDTSHGAYLDNVALRCLPGQGPTTYRIDGHKYETDGEATTTLAGWTINLEDNNSTVLMSTTTDGSGYYYFDVLAGDYEVHEVMQTDWTQVEVRQDGELVETDVDIESCTFSVPEESDYSCDFTNEDVGTTGPILGCTDPQANNYNPAATEDDGSCDYTFVSQCVGTPNLLANASFEEPVVTENGGTWQIFSSVPNWLISLSDGLELWRGLGVGASDGEQNAELAGNTPTKITQTVTTTPGATYELSFDFAARSDASAAANNHIEAAADGVSLVNVSTSSDSWYKYGATFVADASTSVSFEDIGTSDGTGTLLDNTALCLVSLPDNGTDQTPTTVRSSGGGGGGATSPICRDLTLTNGMLEWETSRGRDMSITANGIEIFDTSDDDEVDAGSLYVGLAGNMEYILTVNRFNRDDTCTVSSDFIGGVGGDFPQGMVLGEQVSVVPYGGAAAGTGGTSPIEASRVQTPTAIVLRNLLQVAHNG